MKKVNHTSPSQLKNRENRFTISLF